MFTIARNVGRFVEVRIASSVTIEELTRFRSTIAGVFAGAADKVLVCCDLRGARVFPPDVAEGFVAIMRYDNPRLEKSAFLTSESATFSLQVERMIRDAGNDQRRAFRDLNVLTAWLDETMTHAERKALQGFLAFQFDAAAAPPRTPRPSD